MSEDSAFVLLNGSRHKQNELQNVWIVNFEEKATASLCDIWTLILELMDSDLMLITTQIFIRRIVRFRAKNGSFSVKIKCKSRLIRSQDTFFIQKAQQTNKIML